MADSRIARVESGWGALRTTLEMIKIEHSVFALPFALSGAILAQRGVPDAAVLFWIVVAMVGARSSAMAFNRLVDLHYDALNPRTRERALPAGRLRVAQVWVFTVVTAAVMVLAAWRLNPLALTLSPVALLVIWGYSFTKRYTSLCHLFLGAAIGIAPSAAWIAVTGRLEWTAVILSAAVMLWVGGFDVLYALQDEEFDRQHGLRSLPERLGTAKALGASRVMHAAAVCLLLDVHASAGMGAYYLLGVGLVTGLLVYEHALVRPGDLSRLNAAFFTVNGYVSIAFFGFTLLDVVLG